MAKTNICTSLCVCEGIQSSNQWRRIADLNKMGESEFFYNTPKGVKPEFIPCKQGSDNIADVKVIDWQMQDGKVTGTMNTLVHVIEIADVRAFASIYVEDEDAIRKLLLDGICVPNILAKPFANGTTTLAFVIKSKNGHKYGLLMADKSKILIRDDAYRGALTGSSTFRIADTPTDSQRSAHTLPIVDLEDIGVIEYNLPSGNGSKRQFLVMSPRQVGQIYLYPISKYVPIYMKRQLNRSKSTIQLSNDRALTGKDISAIMTSVLEALRDKEAFGELMQISDAAAAEDISIGVAAYLKSLKKDLTQNSELSEQIRNFMWADDDIRNECMAYGKDVWADTHSKEVNAAREELAAVQKTVEAEQKKVKSVLEEREKLLTECDTAKRSLTDINSQYDHAREIFRDNLQQYRADLASLATACGLGSGTPPMISSAKLLPCNMIQNGSFDEAMSSNLESFLSEETATAVTEFTMHALQRSMHIAVNGTFANIFATALSAAIDGMEPSVVTRTDNDCSAADVIRAIESQSGHVVLLEGVFGCAADMFTLAVARRVHDKIVIFSMDDMYGTENMTKTMFAYIAVLKDLAQEVSTPEDCHWEQADGYAVSTEKKLGYEPFPETGCAKELSEYQNNLVQGEATL